MARSVMIPHCFICSMLPRKPGAYVLITARTWPESWGVALPDLASRLSAEQRRWRLNEPDDALLRVVLVKLFADRQLMVDPTVIDYIVLRMERSLAAAALTRGGAA